MTRSWAFTACCALAIVLVLLPSPWHWKARNTGTLLYIGWCMTGCLIFGINSIIWAGNFEDYAPIWCDITTKLIVGMTTGLTAASLCINRRLYSIATIKNVTVDRDSRRRRAIIDLLLGLGMPVIVMALSIVTQGSRYVIYEDVGCLPSIHPTLLILPLVYMWPLLISFASFIYSALAIRAFLRARRSFTQSLNNAHGGMNTSRYFRLMGLSAGEMIFSLPSGIYQTYTSLSTPQFPWVSWEYAHYDFYTIPRTPMKLVLANPAGYRLLMLGQWAFPAGGFLFFLWFGFAGEAMAVYKDIFYKLAAPLGIKPKPMSTVVHSQPTWSSRLTSGISSRAREETQYPSFSEIKDSDTVDEKVSSEIDGSLYKNAGVSNV